MLLGPVLSKELPLSGTIVIHSHVEARGSVKEGPDSDESEEESQESSHHQCLAAKSDPARRPPEPALPPRGHRKEEEDRHRERGAEEREPPTSGKKHKKRDNRGSRVAKKHQRLHRALEDPSVRLHRRPPGHFWDTPDRVSSRDQHQPRRMDEGVFTFENPKTEEWDALTLERGQVIEAEVDVSENSAEGCVWAGFLVQKVELTVMGEMAVTVPSPGSEDPQATKRMSPLFSRRTGVIHLCSTLCAGEDIYALHIGSFRRFDLVNFRCNYITAPVKHMIKKWEKEVILAEDDGSGNIDLTGPDLSAGNAPGGEESPPQGCQATGDPKVAAAGKAAPRRRVAEKEETTLAAKEIDRAKLRERLARAKERITGAATPGGAGTPALPPQKFVSVILGSWYPQKWCTSVPDLSSVSALVTKNLSKTQWLTKR